ncbi:MAG TPA: DNA-deoxyinosine glycosylase [Acidovorax sp.]|jgi:hypoxanthine-DNA glycosylase|nr:DNA-deoxyinosine glycosylase [Acidovorax sp.]
MPVTAPPTPAPRWQGLPPVASEHMVVLVLGSFPGVASLRAGQYYAHPHNQFWKILQALWPSHALPGDYAARCDWLLARGLGVWDVYASCEREGSLDTRIRNAEVNDFARLHGRCPRLAAIAHNGGESFKHARAVRASLGAHSAVESVRLPSTSPAHAAWSFDRKLNAWAALMASHGLI